MPACPDCGSRKVVVFGPSKAIVCSCGFVYEAKALPRVGVRVGGVLNAKR